MSREMTNSTEKKSSTTAKTALGLAIGGLGTALLSNGNLTSGGGLLGGLFGPNEYQQQKIDQGTEAVTELSILQKWIMPVMSQISTLNTEVAVNRAVDEKNQVINSLLFKAVDDRADCRAALNTQRIENNEAYNNLKVTSLFNLANLETDYKIERATCNTIKGTPFISPKQMADPYTAGYNVLMSRHIDPITVASAVDTTSCAAATNLW